MRSATFLYLMN